MIPIQFEYYRPQTLQEATETYHKLSEDNKSIYYYGGGSEIISMSRVGNIKPNAVIDLKEIPECNILNLDDYCFTIGSSVSLNHITEFNYYPLLRTTVRRISDHTNQCRITIGGNVCSTIIYREAVLPLLLTDCKVLIYGNNGIKKVYIDQIFDERMKLQEGEFITQFIIKKELLNLPYFHIKKTKNEKIDYPLLTVAVIKDHEKIKAAFSGICDFPFRSTKIENILNKKEMDLEEKLNQVCCQLPQPPINNIAGSGEYRLFVLKNTMREIWNKIGEI